MRYVRPLVQTGRLRPDAAVPLAGGRTWFSEAAIIERDAEPRIVPVRDLDPEIRDRLTAARPDVAGLAMDRPRIMAILNTTPDSFSDGGEHADPEVAKAQGRALIAAGADILDIGGESTRPGATEIDPEIEIDRTAPIIAAIRETWEGPISIDTRKSRVATAAFEAGASLLNDVSALTFDPDLAGVAAASGRPVCLMHAQGEPQTMQADPRYDDVLLDVYDALEARIAAAEAAGIARARLVADPGIGFGKTAAHNLALLAGLSLFHGLGVPILLGASRKKFIGTLGAASDPHDRAPGSIAVALASVAQGVQILRVHDMAATRQALTLWHAATEGIAP